MNDLISRAEAIDELDKGAWGVEWDKTLAKTMIESLPSAQPTQNTRVNSNNALDTISRQAAIDAVTPFDDEYRIRDAIEDLPSAQPERKRGKWEPWRCDMYKCSECSCIYTELTDPHRCGANYCPNCGADMREVDDGSD